MSDEERKKINLMLKRIQGQVGGINKMIEADKDCEAVLTQISAAMNSLKTVARTLLAHEAVACAETEKGSDRYATLLKRFF
jgi:DNA-binding FrmR family transcriptional regulator